MICLEGKSMTTCLGNTILFRSSQQVPRLRPSPLKGAVSAQKVSETETRELLEGMEEKSVSLTRGH